MDSQRPTSFFQDTRLKIPSLVGMEEFRDTESSKEFHQYIRNGLSFLTGHWNAFQPFSRRVLEY